MFPGFHLDKNGFPILLSGRLQGILGMALDRQHRRKFGLPAGVALCLVAFSLLTQAAAQIGSARYSSIIVDAQTGNVVSAVNADEPRHPASLTKMMTLYMLFEALRDRRISLGQLVPISANAASMSPTKLGLTPGTRITVEEAVLGLVTKSANDAASALGEMMGGSEERFAQMMTLRARALGMNRTVFQNASGLPDPDQWTTSHDMAVLGRRLIIDFPSYYGFFSTPSFTFRRQVIYNHDRLLQTYPGADGMKTGYTQASGYNLVTSAVRGGVRLVGVVMGARSGGERDIHMANLLDQGFEELDVPIARSRPERPLPSVFNVAHASAPPAIVAPVYAAPASTRSGRPQAPRYAVQVGSFASEKAARAAADTAQRMAGDGDTHITPVPGGKRGKTQWRAQLTGLTAAEAPSVCATLSKRKTPCMVLRPEANQVASR
jgi:D-alanyl-D-alanine carboxypeptidase